MNFYRVRKRSLKGGMTEIYPDFMVKRSSDLMVRGKAFYAIWDEARHIWSTDIYDAARLVDEELNAYKNSMAGEDDSTIVVRDMTGYSSKMWSEFVAFMKSVGDNSVQLDSKLTFSNTPYKREDYVSKTLPYPLEPGDFSAYDEIIGTLYDEEERAKIEWAIGSIVAG